MNFRRKNIAATVAALYLAFGVSALYGQPDCLDPANSCTYFSSSNGDWNDAANWDLGLVPDQAPDLSINQQVVIGGQFGSNPATATISATTPIIGDLRIGASLAFDPGGNTGTLEHTAGTLEAAPGKWAFLGVDGTDNTGTYNLSGNAEFINSGEFHIGIGGNPMEPNMGTISLADSASITTNQFRFGTNQGATGIMNQSGGTVTAFQGFIGDAEGFGGDGVPGTGVYNQTGGAVVIQDWLALGRQTDSNGTYNMSGGTLDIALDYLTVGENGNGTMDVSQTADVETANLGIGRFGGGAVGHLRITGDSPAFSVTGDTAAGTPGNVVIGRNDQGVTPFEPVDASGTVEFVATASGVSPINVNGDVYLNDGSTGVGSANLVVDFSALPGSGNVKLFDISGTIDGTFVGLPEGAAVPGSGGRTLTYVGGDGNDIYLLGDGGPAVNGDFNNDGNWDCADIDALVAEVVAGTNDLSFDMNGDGQVNAADVTDTDGWLAVGGVNNPTDTNGGNAFLVGDANLDGSVDVSDFNIWNGNRFTATPAWCSGDFTLDGSIDVSDFNAWNGNRFNSSDTHAVPEPGCMWLLLIIGLAPLTRRMRK